MHVHIYVYTYYANRKSGAQHLSRPALQAVPSYVHAFVSYTCMYVQLLQRRIPEPSSYSAQLQHQSAINSPAISFSTSRAPHAQQEAATALLASFLFIGRMHLYRPVYGTCSPAAKGDANRGRRPFRSVAQPLPALPVRHPRRRKPTAPSPFRPSGSGSAFLTGAAAFRRSPIWGTVYPFKLSKIL
jgi:hypothetical protein